MTATNITSDLHDVLRLMMDTAVNGTVLEGKVWEGEVPDGEQIPYLIFEAVELREDDHITGQTENLEAAVGLALSLATAGLMAHPAMRAGLKSQLLDARLRLRGVQPYRGSPVAARIGQQSFEPMRQFRRRA